MTESTTLLNKPQPNVNDDDDDDDIGELHLEYLIVYL